MQCTTATGSRTASEHDATTTMLDSSDSAVRFECITFTLPNRPLVIVAQQLSLCFV